MALHSTLTDPELHEPKGVAAAASGEVYLSDGLGSGSWVVPPYAITGIIDDVSTASSIFLAIPYAGTVTKVVTVLAGSLTGADSTVTVKNSAGTSMGTITVAHSGSAAGDIDTLSPVSNNTVTNDTRISIETDGASSGVAKLFITVYVKGS